jgi:hypothetical protein
MNWKMHGALRMGRAYVTACLEELRQRGHLGDLGVDERITLKLILKEYVATMWKILSYTNWYTT